MWEYTCWRLCYGLSLHGARLSVDGHFFVMIDVGRVLYSDTPALLVVERRRVCAPCPEHVMHLLPYASLFLHNSPTIIGGYVHRSPFGTYWTRHASLPSQGVIDVGVMKD